MVALSSLPSSFLMAGEVSPAPLSVGGFSRLLNENAGATSAPRVPRFEKNTRQSCLVEPPGVLRDPVDARPAELESHCFLASSISSRPFTDASSASF